MRRRNVNVITVPPLIVIYCILHSVYTLDATHYTGSCNNIVTMSTVRKQLTLELIRSAHIEKTIISSFHRVLSQFHNEVC